VEKSSKEPITVEKILDNYKLRRLEIIEKLAEFEDIWKSKNNEKLWEEMVFCFFTGGCSAKMGLRSIEKVRDMLLTGTHEELANALSGTHRYPFARSRYIVASRNFLQSDCDLKLYKKLDNLEHFERRDWLVKTKEIKGLGYKEASHYLRNIGFKGYAILDKHILRCLFELQIIDDPKPPSTRRKYLAFEEKLAILAEITGIDFDELDLVLWSLKTGEILK
jgi:N-glycosylase/DNA lyase